jgi:hypothetical protein
MEGGRPTGWDAVTALTPLHRGWTPWLRVVFAVGSSTTLFVRPLLQQRVIALGRWTLLRRRERPPALLFETNWSGTWESYIDDFARTMPMQWRSIWTGAEGYPGPKPVTDLLRYIEEHDHGADHFYCGYREGATTQTVASALALRPRLERFVRDVDGVEPDEFVRRWRRFLADVQGHL